MTKMTVAMPTQTLDAPVSRGEWGQDALVGTLLTAWIAGALAYELPQLQVLAWLAAGGLFASRLTRLWGFTASLLVLGALMWADPQWVRTDLVVRGAWLAALVNIWLMGALRRPVQQREANPFAAQPAVDQIEVENLKKQLVQEQQVASARQSQLEQVSAECQQAASLKQMLEEKLNQVEQEQLALTERLMTLEPLALETEELREALRRAMDRQMEREEQFDRLQSIERQHHALQETHQLQEQELVQSRSRLSAALTRLLEQQQQQAELQARLHQVGAQEELLHRLQLERQELQQQSLHWRAESERFEEQVQALHVQCEEALTWAADREQKVRECQLLQEQMQQRLEAERLLQERLRGLDKELEEAKVFQEQVQRLQKELEEAKGFQEEVQRLQQEQGALRHQMDNAERQLLAAQRQLADPIWAEAPKKVGMLDRTLSMKEQVITRLSAQLAAQQEEWSQLLQTKHLHKQLRVQFETQKKKSEIQQQRCRQLEAELWGLQERTNDPEPSPTEQQLLQHIQAIEAVWQGNSATLEEILR
ncbi:MAG: hypothetical protein ACOYKZ_05310 [Chlamydiia bacterium]